MACCEVEDVVEDVVGDGGEVLTVTERGGSNCNGTRGLYPALYFCNRLSRHLRGNTNLPFNFAIKRASLRGETTLYSVI